MNTHSISRLCAALLLTALLTSCAVDAPAAETELFPSPTPTTSPTINVPQGPATVDAFGLAYSAASPLNPYTTQSNLNLSLASLIYEGLFNHDGTPLLAASTEGAGTTEWIVNIHTDRQFSDGTPLTSADVTYSLNLARDSAAYKTRMQDITSIRATTESSIVVTTARPYGDIATLLVAPIIRETEDAKHPIGTGAYVLIEAGDESYLRLSPSHQSSDQADIRRIELRDAPDSDVLISGFETGAITAVRFDPLATDPIIFGGLYEEWTYPTSNMIYMGFNIRRPAVQNAELRQILAAAADRANMAALDLAGRALATDYSDGVQTPFYSLVEHLADLGYEDTDEDGILDYSVGRTRIPLELRVLCASSNEYKLAMTERLCEDLRMLGISVTLDALSWDAYTSAINSGIFDICVAETILPANGDLSALAHSGGALNVFGYADEETDALLDALLAATNNYEEAKNALLQKLAKDTPFSPLVFKKMSLIARRGALKDAQPTQWNLYAGMKSGN